METKGTIQTQWSVIEWPGILPSDEELHRKRKCARQSIPLSSCFSNARLMSCLYKPAHTKKRRKTTLAIYARFIFIWYDYIVLVPCQKKKCQADLVIEPEKLAIHWMRDIRLLDFQLNFFFMFFLASIDCGSRESSIKLTVFFVRNFSSNPCVCKQPIRCNTASFADRWLESETICSILLKHLVVSVRRNALLS